jgi:adenylosuccinate lyase
MMDAAKSGVDRQEAHEHLRQATHAAVAALLEGGENPLRELLLADPVLKPFAPRLEALLDPSRSIGRADVQVEEFVREELDPLLARHAAVPEQRAGVRV